MKPSLSPIGLLFFLLIIPACSTPDPVGLWQVERVLLGEHERTPQSRWTRFNADGSQSSGNGWLQHSVGTWTYDPDSALLHIRNSNGQDDPFGPFRVHIWTDSMHWERLEEGRLVRVELVRAEQLPAKPADHLYGLWSLQSTSLAGTDLTESLDPLSRQTLFFRWDQRFVMTNGEGKRSGGYYLPHGHRPWLELIFSGQEAERQYWTYEITDSTLILSQEVDQVTYRERYVRIREFPE